MKGDWVEQRKKEYDWIILESNTFHELGVLFFSSFRNSGTKKLHLLCLTYDRYFGSLFSYYASVHCSTGWVGFFFFFLRAYVYSCCWSKAKLMLYLFKLQICLLFPNVSFFLFLSCSSEIFHWWAPTIFGTYFSPFSSFLLLTNFFALLSLLDPTLDRV